MAAAALTELLAAAADHQGRWEFGAAREILAGLIAEADPADESLELLSAKRMLAEVLRELGRTDEAHVIAVGLLAACEARLGPAHPATVRATAVLAAIVHDRAEPLTEAGGDDLARAEGLYLDVIAGHERADPADADPADSGPGGPTARAVALARANLALLHRDRGDVVRARDELMDVYAQFRRVHGNGDPDTIRLAVELAALQRQCGDLPAARRLLTVAHSAAQAAFAEDHPLTRVVEFELTEVEPPIPMRLDATGRQPGPRGVLRRGAHEQRALPAAPVSPPGPAPMPVAPAALAIPRQRPPALPSPSPSSVLPASPSPSPSSSPPAPALSPGRPRVTRSTRARLWVPPRRPSARWWRIAAVPVSVVGVLVVAAAIAISRDDPGAPPPDGSSVAQSVAARVAEAAATPRAATAPSASATPRASIAPPSPLIAPPAPSYPPPAAVAVRDDRRSLTVTWTDLSQVAIQSTVTIGRPGHAPIIVAPVPAGASRFTLTGVSPDFDYCATVTLTYGPGTANQVSAEPVCTRRQSGR